MITKSHVLGRRDHANAPVAATGDGCWIVDTDGRRYLDASAGPAVSCLGHSNRVVADAVTAQLERVAFPYSGFFTTEAAEELARRLAVAAPGRPRSGLPRVRRVRGRGIGAETGSPVLH